MLRIVLIGLASLCALILLTACAAPRVVPEIRIVEIPRPVIQPIPEQRIEPLMLPMLHDRATNADLAETLGQCTDTLHRANLDRAWLSARQDRGSSD